MGNSELSKHERRLLKHRSNKKKHVAEEKKSKLEVTISLKSLALIIAVIIFIFSAYWMLSLQDAPSINVSPNQIGLGNVSVSAGEKSASFSLSNIGKSDLVITGMVTSCMCTSASLIVEGEESPRFGMHNNVRGWQQAIKPGQAAELKVYYDPTVHPELRGPVTRTVSISTNDPLFLTKIVTISANQVD